MCFRNDTLNEVNTDEIRMAEQFLEVHSVKELITIYQPAMCELGRSFARLELISAVLGYYTPNEVVRQYAHALISGNGRIL